MDDQAKVELKPGDVVMLNSGGPMMCIANIRDGKATCSWFDREERYHRENVPLESLRGVAASEAAFLIQQRESVTNAAAAYRPVVRS